jgi:hypothetical protein
VAARRLFDSAEFVSDAAAEIRRGKLEGLNFDWEPSRCAQRSDSSRYAGFIERVARQSSGLITVTFPCLHDACDPAVGACCTPVMCSSGDECRVILLQVLAQAAARVIDMQTYGGGGVNGTWDPVAWGRVFHGHVAAVGAARYGMGVCPQCCQNPPACDRPLSAADIASRLRMAEAAGVVEIDVFSDVEPPHDPYNASRYPVRSSMPWWDALRRWKRRRRGTAQAHTAENATATGRQPTNWTASVPEVMVSATTPRRLPPSVRFIAAENDTHCVPGEAGAIWFEAIDNHTRWHVTSCSLLCGMADASGPCCNITRLPCSYILALRPCGTFQCSDILVTRQL